MGRVPKKHRRPMEYTEAIDSNEIDEQKFDTNKAAAGDEIKEKCISENGSGVGEALVASVGDNEDDDFKSVNSDVENEIEEVKVIACNEDNGDDEPLRKTARVHSKDKQNNNNHNANKKKPDRKLVKKTAPKAEEEYEVQEIVGHKVERGIDYYLVRWKGYSKADDSWEPLSTLSCPDLIQKFKKKQSLNKDKLKQQVQTKSSKDLKKKIRGRPVPKTQQEDPNKQWEVEKIIDYAEEKSGRLFRIRWKGFGVKHDTWEPEKNLCCDEIIAKFMQRVKAQEYVSFKELRVSPKKPKRLVNETQLRTTYHNAIGRKSKRATTKKRVFYGDSD